MSMVGPDKRLNYYRLTSDEVIAALHSHRMGLTNAEARRRAEVQQNVLPPPQEQPLIGRYVLRAQPITLLAFMGIIGLTVALGDSALTAALAALMLAHLILTWVTWSDRQASEPSFAPLLPSQTHVARNGQTETITTAAVVVGDIVYLQAGDVAPADIRLINEQNMTANDKVILGSSAHVRKFAHALESDVPLASRNNLVFAGTTVVTGEAHGVVIATGAQTELGRIQQLAHRQSRQPTDLERRLHRQRTALTLGGLAFLIFAALATIKTEPTNTARMLLLALVVLIGGTLPYLQQLAGIAVRGRFARAGIKARGLHAIESLGHADILLCDPTAFSDDAAVVASFVIGRTTYTVNGDGYEPHGKVLDSQGKPVTKKSLREFSLIFEAATLAHHAAVLAPDAEHSTWHPHGNFIEAALLTAARRAGMQTEQLRDRHELLGFFPHDAHRQLQSAIRNYGKDSVLFVLGSPEALIARSTKLWDHGHVRPLSTRDTTQLAMHQTRQSAAGLTCLALAYRILPKNANIQNLSMERSEQKLTFLGIMDIEHDVHAHARALLQTVQSGHTRTSLLTNHASGYTIDSGRLRRMSDEHLLERLRKGSATFSQLGAEDKVRLVSVAQRARHTVAMCGASLSDLPALKLADVAFSPNTSSPWLKQVTTMRTHDITGVASAIPLARDTTNRISHSFGVLAISQFAALTLSFLGTVSSVFLHIPLGITPLQLLVLLTILQPLAAVSACTYAAHGHTKEVTAMRTTFTLGICAGGLALANFLVFFVRSNISPAYLDPTSTLAARATTLTFVSLVLALGIDALLGLREQRTLRRLDWHMRNAATVASLAGIAIVLGILYLEPLHALLHTQGLELVDWLYIIFGATLYTCLHAFERKTRHHSRYAVVQLHRQKFGKKSLLRI